MFKLFLPILLLFKQLPQRFSRDNPSPLPQQPYLQDGLLSEPLALEMAIDS